MTFKMKGWSGYQKSPAKHTIAQGHKAVKDVPHVHKVNPMAKDKSEVSGDTYSDEEMIVKDESGKADLTTPGFVKEEKEVKEKKDPKKKKRKRRNKPGTVVSRLVKKVFSGKGKRRGGKRRTRNLVTGGWNITRG